MLKEISKGLINQDNRIEFSLPHFIINYTIAQFASLLLIGPYLLFEQWNLTLTNPLHTPTQRSMVCRGLVLCPCAQASW